MHLSKSQHEKAVSFEAVADRMFYDAYAFCAIVLHAADYDPNKGNCRSVGTYIRKALRLSHNLRPTSNAD